MSDKKRLANVIRDALLDIDRSQKYVADVMGVDRKTVNRWVNGKQSPRATQLMALIKMTSNPSEFMARLVAE